MSIPVAPTLGAPATINYAEDMPPSPEWAKYVRLRVVRHLSDVIHRWFRVEIAFADETGYVRAYPGNKIFDPTNAVCRMVLNTRDGFRGCIASSRETFHLVQLKKPGEKKLPGGFAENRCHMGFRKIVVPVEVDGRVIGSVIAGGIVPQGEPEQLKADLISRAGRYGIDSTLVAQAFDHLPKVDELSLQYLCELIAGVVREVATFHKEIQEKDASIARLTEELHGKYAFGAIIGASKPMRDMLSMLEKVCASDSTVLIQGENGTGKELVARAVHANSHRKDKPFLMQSAAAFNENLLESELFGHVKGSFTGAIKDKRGLFE
ncbi:MAG TPA: sigma 54-interacting transcriptional regulator, partial [bacterium]|nr:sigma 54-interacting transcriptional regulator [bacterium]